MILIVCPSVEINDGRVDEKCPDEDDCDGKMSISIPCFCGKIKSILRNFFLAVLPVKYKPNTNHIQSNKDLRLPHSEVPSVHAQRAACVCSTLA
jgi:hypothetical protein